MAIVKIIKIEYIKFPLKELRVKKGLTIRKLAELSNVSFSHISKAEQNLPILEGTYKKLIDILS